MCASGSQVWSGKTGVFTMKAMAKPRNNHRCVVVLSVWLATTRSRSKLTRPPGPAWALTARATIDTSMKAEPAIVKMKNLVAA